ncbi:MAG: Uma2 family endonuclease [Chamaesiphon sp. CSU_1_12]|nr:Uma2 family endonuclease [Chamaesiphon sp. CSU_1_12]
MVAIKDNLPRFTPEEYFAWEEKQLEKHEYIGGEVYAMTGGTINHSRIALKFGALLDNFLSGSSCQAANSDCRVNIVESNDFTYPDVSVTCDDRDRSNTKYITYPCLLVEVLSESTEAYDRGGKFRMYRQNPILQDYVLVSSEKIEVDLYRKTESGSWEIINYQAGDTIDLKSINLTFPIEQIYQGISFVPAVE